MKSVDVLPSSESLASPADGRMALAPGRLKSLRLRLGFSQEALAEYCIGRRLCVSIASIKRAESGKSVLYRTARHLAAAYDVTLEELLPPGAEGPADAGTAEADEAVAEAAGLAAFAAASDGDEPASRSVVVLALPKGAVLTPAQRAEAEHLVAQFGGVPTAAEGAAWVAAFGMPQAYGSDTARCVECAVALSGRLGASAGPLVVGLAEWDHGRLQLPSALREAGAEDRPASDEVRVLVERTCSAMLMDQFDLDFQDTESHASAFAVLRREAPGTSRARRPLIARYAQLQQFKTILDDAHATQCGHVVHLRGVAGIGKSRLVREFGDIARQWGFVCHEGAVLDFGTEARTTAWGQLVRSLLAIPPLAEAEEAALLPDRLRELRLAADLEMPLRALLGLPQKAEHAAVHAAMEHTVRRRRAVEALQALLLRAAMAQPVAVVMEDIHWADAAFLDVFALLLSLTRDAAVTWITTSRYDGDPLDAHLRPHFDDQPLTVFDLSPLRPVEAEALALQHGGVDESHRRQCIQRARGNALFLTQLLLAPGHELPDSLRHLVQAQLDRLPADDRRALRAASAIGQQFPLSLLCEVLEDPSYRPDVPTRAHLLKPTVAGTGMFVHDLVMHCIYESIAPAQRRYLHKRLATLYRDRSTVLWARHLARAEDAEAPAAYLHAIREQLAAHGNDAALELADQCRRIRHAEVDLHALELLAAEALARTMRNQDARDACERARAAARTPREQLDAMLGLAAILNVLDKTEEEDELLEAALPIARGVGDDALLARLHYLQGNIRFPRGQFAAGRALHEQALRHARAGGAHDLEARSLSGLGDSLYAEGRMNQAHAVFSDCLEICRQHDLTSIEASNLFMRGTVRIYLGRTEDALADALAAAALGRRVGNRRAEIVSRLTAGWVLLSVGRLGEARAEIEEGLRIAKSMGAVRFEPFLNESLARVSFLEGQHAVAVAQITDACDAMERLKLHKFIGPWLLGTLALLSDDADVRHAALERGHALLANGCVGHNRYRFHVAAAEVALLEGDAARAAREVEQLRSATADDPCEWVAHHHRVVEAYGQWLAEPSDAARAAVQGLHRQGVNQGFSMAAPRLHKALAAL